MGAVLLDMKGLIFLVSRAAIPCFDVLDDPSTAVVAGRELWPGLQQRCRRRLLSLRQKSLSLFPLICGRHSTLSLESQNGTMGLSTILVSSTGEPTHCFQQRGMGGGGGGRVYINGLVSAGCLLKRVLRTCY